MILVQHAIRLVVRDGTRTLASVVGVAIASALITSVLLFGAASGATVTRRALGRASAVRRSRDGRGAHRI